MSKQTLILGVVGSIRSNHKNMDKLKDMIEKSKSSEELNQFIKESNLIYSNTDIGIAHALVGAVTNNSKIELVCITNLFAHQNLNLYGEVLNYDSIEDLEDIDTLSINDNEYKILLEKVKNADGVILGTPVYFGDRSSVANKFLQLTQKFELLKDKAFGVISCGAKRNGGQETTNIYSLYEALMQDSVVIGNGPASCQYGGTIWAGDVGKAVDDDFGNLTSYGTGRQVAHLASILKAGEEKNEKVKITVLVTMDTEENKYLNIVKEYFDKYSNKDVELEIFTLIKENIYRCIACEVCPSPKFVEKYKDEEYPYHCIIQTKQDSMKFIQEKLVNRDGIVLVGVNSKEDLTYRYQSFMERTRFIRHDDFELTNTPIIGLLINELGATNNPIFNVKVLTSFIRHNTFFLKPFEIVMNNEEVIFENSFVDVIAKLKKIKSGRNAITALDVSYKATGYKNKQLDNTVKSRR